MEHDLRRWIRLCEAAATVTAYHGTHQRITGSFRAGFARDAKENAIFFTSAIADAEAFPRVLRSADSVYVYEATLDISRFHRVDYERYQTQYYAEMGERNDADPDIYMPEVVQCLIANLRTKTDHPGVVIHGIRNFESEPPSTTYAVFDPAVILTARLLGENDDA